MRWYGSYFMVIVLRLWKELTIFFGEGEMAILFFLGLKMLSFGYHLYFEGSRIPECTVF